MLQSLPFALYRWYQPQNRGKNLDLQFGSGLWIFLMKKPKIFYVQNFVLITMVKLKSCFGCSKWVKIAKNQKWKFFLPFLVKYTFPHHYQASIQWWEGTKNLLMLMWECILYQKREKFFHFLVFGDFNPFSASETTFQLLHRDQHKIWDIKIFWFLHQKNSKSRTKL